MSHAHQLETEFLKIWRRFRTLLSDCQQALAQDTDHAIWLYDTPSNEARQALVSIVGQIFYEDDQPPRETLSLPGIAGASRASLQAARQLNASKDRLRESLQAMDKHIVHEKNPETGRHRKQRLTDGVLATHGLARLHRMQAYRHLHCLDSAPDKVGLTWAHTRRVSTTTVAALRTELERMHKRGGAQAPLIERDMARLGPMKDDDKLALVHSQPLHARANLAWRVGEKLWDRRQLTLSLPLLYPAASGEVLPELSRLRDPESVRLRSRNEGRRLEDAPFLSTLPIYRYLEEENETALGGDEQAV